MLYMRLFQAEQLGQKFYRARKFSYNFYAEEILFYPGLEDSSTSVYVCMYVCIYIFECIAIHAIYPKHLLVTVEPILISI